MRFSIVERCEYKRVGARFNIIESPKCEYKGGGVGLIKTSERRVECRSVSTNEGGGEI